MGDRANVLIGDEQSRVYLYTHWGGHDLPLTVQRALKRTGRFTDAPYLARVIFSQMILDGASDDPASIKNNLVSDTGYGIATYMSDNEHPIIYLETMTQRVYYIRPEDASEWNERSAAPIASWSMSDYADSDLDDIMTLWS